MNRDLFSLEGKIVAVTGATGLIGSAICKALSERGATIVAVGRSLKKAESLLDFISKAGGNACYAEMDISDLQGISCAISLIMKRHTTIDVWINCAFPRESDWSDGMENVRTSSITRDINSHLVGYFECSRHACFAMRSSGGGSLINMSSIYGVVAPRFDIYAETHMTCAPAYPMIKGGIVTLTKYLASFFAKDGIRANCIAPGGVYDGQEAPFVEAYKSITPMMRMAQPDDVVGAVLFFASQASAYITGQTLCVDGGLTAV